MTIWLLKALSAVSFLLGISIGDAAAEESVCLCVSGDAAVAWFTYRPKFYGNSNASVSVHTGTCDPFVSCPGGSFRNWSGSIRSIGWSTNTNLLNGHTIWLLNGTIE